LSGSFTVECKNVTVKVLTMNVENEETGNKTITCNIVLSK